MADDKNGREKQARDAERRQRERALAEELERGDEPAPPIDETQLGEFEAELDSVSFPATGADVVAALGDREVETDDRSYTVEELVPAVEEETFEAPADLRSRVRRPTVAAAMKRILEASDTLPEATLRGSQRDAYEKTLVELRAIDAADDDEGVRVITDWVLERISDREELPGSRDVRRQAAKFCRSNGYSVRNDEWLGV